MKYKAIIFDMDGTIIDTDHIWESATRKLILSKGVILTPELEEELSRQLRGLALIKSCQIIKDLTKIIDPIEELIEQKSKLACSMYSEGVKFIPGFLEFHHKLKDHNIKSGIATNADDDTLNITKKALKLEQYFGGHIYNISHVNNIYKPNPALYLHAAKQLNIDPKDCIAIEDSAHGVKAAKAAGMYCIGINTSKNRNFLLESDHIIESYDEIDLNKLLLKKNNS